MPKTIDQLLAEADEIIEKRASASKEDTTEEISDDILKLAEQLSSTPVEDGADEPVENNHVNTLLEKISHSLAITEVFANLPYLKKAAEFEKQASEQGHSPEKIQGYLEKAASRANYVRMSDMVPWLAGEQDAS